MTEDGDPVLVRILDGQLKDGQSTELDLVHTMNAAINDGAPDREAATRCQVLLCMSGALRGLITRRCFSALFTGRLCRAWQLHESLWDVTEFSLELAKGAGEDPDADFIRVQLLQLTLARRGADTAGEFSRAVRAMARVASAGTTPLE